MTPFQIAALVLLVYIARKLQQLCRKDSTPMTPWWWEIGHAVNHIRPGTF